MDICGQEASSFWHMLSVNFQMRPTLGCRNYFLCGGIWRGMVSKRVNGRDTSFPGLPGDWPQFVREPCQLTGQDCG